MPASRVQRLMEDHDLAGLEKILRNRADPALRIETAEALGSLGDLEAVELLARAILQDPDREVQRAAHRSLSNLVGAETNTVISTYRHHLAVTGAWQSGSSADKNDEQYLLDTPVAGQGAGVAGTFEDEGEAVEEPDEAPIEEEWDQQNLDGMITVLSHETNPKIRLQAIQALQNSSNMRAIEILSAIALDDENQELSQAARAALEKRFGEAANDIIDSYRKSSEGEEEFDEEDEIGDDEPEDTEEIYQGPVDTPRTTSTFGDYNRSSVIQEDRIGWRLILLAVLVLVIAGGIVFFLLAH